MLQCDRCGVINAEYFKCGCGRLLCREHYPCYICDSARDREYRMRENKRLDEEIRQKERKEKIVNWSVILIILLVIVLSELFYY